MSVMWVDKKNLTIESLKYVVDTRQNVFHLWIIHFLIPDLYEKLTYQ
jgi:hypothetical protein